MWLGNFTLVLPNEVVDAGSVRIEDGVIAEIARSRSQAP